MEHVGTSIRDNFDFSLRIKIEIRKNMKMEIICSKDEKNGCQ